MARTLREWLKSSEFLRNHPRIANLVGSDAPHLWVPQRRTVALSVAIGAVIMVLPLPGQCLIAALVAIRFRLHLPTTVIVTLVSNPLTMLPLMGLAWMIGALLLGQPLALPAGLAPGDGLPWTTGMRDAAGPFLVGLPTLAILLSMLGYGLTHAGWRWAVVRKWRSRAARRSHAG